MENRDHIKKHVDLVILLIDDYTNKIISPNQGWVRIKGEKLPIQKSEGYHVFCNCSKQDTYELEAEGGFYQSKKILIARERDHENQVIIIRLQPNSFYDRYRINTIIQGKTLPNQKIYFYFNQKYELYKLGKNYEEGNQILIYGAKNQILDGMLFSICKGNEEESELFQIVNADFIGISYASTIEKPLTQSYSRAEAKIKRIYEVEADHKGDFYYLVPTGEEESETYRYMMPNSRNFIEGELQLGKINEIRIEGISD